MISIEISKDTPLLNTFYRGYTHADKAYTFLEQGIINTTCSMLTEQHGYQAYEAHAIHESIAGLNAYILTPQDPINNEVHITFAGTYDIHGVVRDFEPNSAGHESFKIAYDEMSAHIKEILSQQELDQPIKLVISGHSLGGAVAENLLAHILDEKANQGAYTEIGSIELFSFSSPGLSESCVNSAEVNLSKVLNQDDDFHLELHYARAEDDPVPLFGEKHILVDTKDGRSYTDLIKVVKDPNLGDTAFSNPLYMIANKLGASFACHQLDWFDKEGHAPHIESYQYLSSKNEGEFEKLESIMHGKFSILAGVLELPKTMIYYGLKWLGFEETKPEIVKATEIAELPEYSNTEYSSTVLDDSCYQETNYWY